MLAAALTHPRWTDVAYQRRRDELAARAAGPGRPPAVIAYRPEEDQTWATVAAALGPLRERHASRAVRDAAAALGLPAARVPQLADVTRRLQPLSGFRFEAVAGLVDTATFFASLASGCFLSTQYVRHPDWPLYTPEPDVIHEVMGHGAALAEPRLAELHRMAGAAMVATNAAGDTRRAQQVADVFWFSAEFGVVWESGAWKAYGAGLLSSFGELGWFADHAEIRPLDPDAMASLPYDITRYQPTLFGAESLDHLLDVLGSWFLSTASAAGS